MLHNLKEQWEHILYEFQREARLEQGRLVVIGCSTSEILGKKIGKASSKEVADVLVDPLLNWADHNGLYLAVQCCEHLNRVLIVERECAEKFGLDPVIVIPSLTAGGAMSLAAWERFSSPVAVEEVKAHAGIDIGDTFIGMHLRPVAVPVRIDVNSLGDAHLTLVKTRPKSSVGQGPFIPAADSSNILFYLVVQKNYRKPG